MNEFGDKLLELRKANKMSREALSVKLDMSAKQIERYEKGEFIPDIDKLNKLSEIFSYNFLSLLSNSKAGQIAKEVILNNGSNLYFLASKKAIEIIVSRYLAQLVKDKTEEDILTEIYSETDKQLTELAAKQ